MKEHPGELLSAFVDGELDAAKRNAVESHLASCSECREEVARIRALSAALVPPAPLDELTTKRFLAENRKRRSMKGGTSAAARGGSGLRESAYSSGPFIALALAAIVIASMLTFVALGGPLRSMFAGAVGTGTMGQNQAALSGGIY